MSISVTSYADGRQTYHRGQPDGTRFGVPVWYVDWRTEREPSFFAERLGLIEVDRDPLLRRVVYARQLLAPWPRLCAGVAAAYYETITAGIRYGVLLDNIPDGVCISTWRTQWDLLRTFTPNPLAWVGRVRAEEQGWRSEDVTRSENRGFVNGFREGGNAARRELREAYAALLEVV